MMLFDVALHGKLWLKSLRNSMSSYLMELVEGWLVKKAEQFHEYVLNAPMKCFLVEYVGEKLFMESRSALRKQLPLSRSQKLAFHTIKQHLRKNNHEKARSPRLAIRQSGHLDNLHFHLLILIWEKDRELLLISKYFRRRVTLCHLSSGFFFF